MGDELQVRELVEHLFRHQAGQMLAMLRAYRLLVRAGLSSG